MLDKIQTQEQLIGICQALDYQTALSKPIEEEKDFKIEVIKTQCPNVFNVEISYIPFFIGDKSNPHRYTGVLIVKIGKSVMKIVKDILDEIEAIYKADLPIVRDSKEFDLQLEY